MRITYSLFFFFLLIVIKRYCCVVNGYVLIILLISNTISIPSHVFRLRVSLPGDSYVSQYCSIYCNNGDEKYFHDIELARDVSKVTHSYITPYSSRIHFEPNISIVMHENLTRKANGFVVHQPR